MDEWMMNWWIDDDSWVKRRMELSSTFDKYSASRPLTCRRPRFLAYVYSGTMHFHWPTWNTKISLFILLLQIATLFRSREEKILPTQLSYRILPYLSLSSKGLASRGSGLNVWEPLCKKGEWRVKKYDSTCLRICVDLRSLTLLRWKIEWVDNNMVYSKVYGWWWIIPSIINFGWSVSDRGDWLRRVISRDLHGH